MQNFGSSTALWQTGFQRLWTGLSIGMCASMLTACCLPTPPLPERALLPPNLVQPCPDLMLLEDGTGAAVLRKLVEVSEQYHACQSGKSALIEAVGNR